MSFTSLTSHVILLMLVSWMGAELLASGNRTIRRVFGKLSVLLGMYALTCLLIDVSNLTHGHAPFIGLPVSGNHAVRRGSVCDSTYRRIQERTMMVDYSDWLNSLPGEFHLNTGWFLVIAIVSVSVMFLILARCRDLTDSLGWEKCQACITSLIIAAWAIGLLWLSTTTGTEPQYLTFTEKTERTFNVSHLRCENIGGCPSKKLPEDRTEATWLQGNRYVKGWILVDGNKVGLVGSNGILLTVKES